MIRHRSWTTALGAAIVCGACLLPPILPPGDGGDVASGMCSPGTTRPCYSGPPGSMTHHPCMPGLQVCEPSGTWSATCAGEHTPMPEQCNGIDDNCDGNTDECPGGMVCTNLVAGGMSCCTVMRFSVACRFDTCNAFPATMCRAPMASPDVAVCCRP